MKKSVTVFALLAALVPGPAFAQMRTTDKWGWGLLATGGVMTLAAFDFHPGKCPDGYTTHTFSNGVDEDAWCARVTGVGSDVRPQTGSASLERPGLVWGGVASLATGIVLLALPKRVQAIAPSVVVTPAGVTATKRIAW